MEPFKSKWGEIIQRVLVAYPMGSPGLVLALESVCVTAQQQGESIGQSKSAADVCDAIHAGPPTGLKCLACYHAEVNYVGEAEMQLEIEKAQREMAREDAEARRLPGAEEGFDE